MVKRKSTPLEDANVVISSISAMDDDDDDDDDVDCDSSVENRSVP